MRAPALAAILLAALSAPASATPGEAAQACRDQAARYENGKGFAFLVIRAGEVRVSNPLRPLTPEITQILEVVIAGKRATAYGPDFTSLRRGASPGAIQSSLGAPINWEPALPPLPQSLGIVADDGVPLAELTFRQCEAAPVLAPEPAPASEAAKKGGRAKKAAGTGSAPGTKAQSKAAKTPSGFSMPQGAIGE